MVPTCTRSCTVDTESTRTSRTQSGGTPSVVIDEYFAKYFHMAPRYGVHVTPQHTEGCHLPWLVAKPMEPVLTNYNILSHNISHRTHRFLDCGSNLSRTIHLDMECLLYI